MFEFGTNGPTLVAEIVNVGWEIGGKRLTKKGVAIAIQLGYRRPKISVYNFCSGSSFGDDSVEF